MDQLTFEARGGRLGDDPPLMLDRVDLIGARSVTMGTCRPIGAAPLDAEGRRSAGHGMVPWP